MTAGGPTADETFRQIAAGEIEMAEDTAQLTGHIEPWDRFIEPVHDLLMDVVHRSTVGILA